jgi:hypothetical protein
MTIPILYANIGGKNQGANALEIQALQRGDKPPGGLDADRGRGANAGQLTFGSHYFGHGDFDDVVFDLLDRGVHCFPKEVCDAGTYPHALGGMHSL